MTLKCPHCRKSLKIADRLAGRNVKCPGCGGVLSVPTTPSATTVSATDSDKADPGGHSEGVGSLSQTVPARSEIQSDVSGLKKTPDPQRSRFSTLVAGATERLSVLGRKGLARGRQLAARSAPLAARIQEGVARRVESLRERLAEFQNDRFKNTRNDEEDDPLPGDSPLAEESTPADPWPPLPLPLPLDEDPVASTTAPDSVVETMALADVVEPMPIVHKTVTLTEDAALPEVVAESPPSPNLVDSAVSSTLTGPAFLDQAEPPEESSAVGPAAICSVADSIPPTPEAPPSADPGDGEPAPPLAEPQSPAEPSEAPAAYELTAAPEVLPPPFPAPLPLESQTRKGESADRIDDGEITLREILAVPFQDEILSAGFYVGLRYVGAVIVSVIGFACLAMLADLLPPGLGVTRVFVVLSMVFLALGPPSLLYGYYLSTAQAYESGDMIASDPHPGLADLLLAFAVTLIGLIPLAIFLLQAPTADMQTVEQARGVLESGPGWALGALLSLLAACFYCPMGLAVAGAYRSLNPLRVLLAIGRAFPTYFLVLLWMVPVMAIAAGIAFGLNILLAFLVTLAPEAIRTWLAMAALPVSVLLSVGIMQHPALSMFAMLGLILRRHHDLLSPTSEEGLPIAAKMAALVAVTCGIIFGVIPNLGTWMSAVVTTISPPNYEPWSASHAAAIQQLEAQGAKVTREPRSSESGRFWIMREVHDFRTNKATRYALPVVTVDLRNSEVGDEAIDALRALGEWDRDGGELRRIIVRHSKLTPAGIAQLREHLPQTEIEE